MPSDYSRIVRDKLIAKMSCLFTVTVVFRVQISYGYYVGCLQFGALVLFISQPQLFV